MQCVRKYDFCHDFFAAKNVFLHGFKDDSPISELVYDEKIGLEDILCRNVSLSPRSDGRRKGVCR